eukprot:g19394.t1
MICQSFVTCESCCIFVTLTLKYCIGIQIPVTSTFLFQLWFLYQRALGCDPYSLQGCFAVSASVGKVQQADLQECPSCASRCCSCLSCDSHLRNLLWDSKQKQAYSVDEMIFKVRALPGVQDLSEMQLLFSKPTAQPVRQLLCQCLAKQPDQIVDFVRRLDQKPVHMHLSVCPSIWQFLGLNLNYSLWVSNPRSSCFHESMSLLLPMSPHS